MIYGVALLAACMFVGSYIGNILGLLTGLNSDIGGVGFAMILLLLATNSKKVTSLMPKNYEKGLEFWKEMFIPVIIAMSSSQDVYHALSGGMLAFVGGIAVVVASFLMVALLSRVTAKKNVKEEKAEVEA